MISWKAESCLKAFRIKVLRSSVTANREGKRGAHRVKKKSLWDSRVNIMSPHPRKWVTNGLSGAKWHQLFIFGQEAHYTEPQHLTLIYLGSYYFIICLTFSHLQVQNKLLFNPVAGPLLPTPTHTYSHSTQALLTVCVKWGCRYFRVSMASLLRRESPLSFPPWPRSLSPHANTVDKASFCCWGSLWRPI